MSKLLTDILPKISQWESIKYTSDFNCPHCNKSGFFDVYREKKERPNIVGWCESNIGYMGVFEYPICFEKYRFHSTIGVFDADIDEFNRYLYYKVRECVNWEEIKQIII